MGVIDAWKARLTGNYARAADLYRSAGKFKEAMEMYAQGRHFDQAARTALALGDHARAVEYFLQDNNYDMAADILVKQGKMTQAVECYARGKRFDKVAQIWERAGNWEKAAAAWVQAKRKDMAASAFIRAGKPDQAAPLLEDLLAAVRANPLAASDAAGQTRKYAAFLGKYFYERGESGKAAPYFELAGQPVDAARAYAADRNYRKSVELLVKEREWSLAAEVIALMPSVPPGDLETYGDALCNAGKFERAAELFLKGGFHFRAAECYEEVGNVEQAARIYAQKDDHLRAGELLEQMEQYEDAARHYLLARNYLKAARCLEQAGTPEKAAGLYLQGQRPLEAARLFLANQEQEKAITALQQVPPEHPQHRDAALHLALLFTKVGRYELAIQKFREAIGSEKLSPASADKYYHLAICLEEMKAYDKAREIYTRILAVQFAFRDVEERLKVMEARRAAQPSLDQTAQLVRQKTGGKISNRYEITDSLDETHYKAWDSSLGRVVSVRRSSAAEVARLWPTPQERLRALASLSHPNLVTLYDTAAQGDDMFLFYEYVGGMTLAQILSARASLPVAEAVRIGAQVARGLEHAHSKNVAHGQVLPSHVWLSGDNAVQLGEFALAAPPAESRAPESSPTALPSVAEDVWQFARLMVQLMTGRPPKDARSLPAELPSGLADVLRRALAADPSQRPAAMHEFLTAFADMGLMPGAVIAGRYEVTAELGSGGMGRIYRAMDREIGEEVALKFLHRNLSRDAEARGRFLREIKIMRRLTHPNIVRVHDLGRWEDMEFLTMELLEAESLEDLVKRRGKLPFREAVGIMEQVCDGLDAAHRHGITHRDIKPQNILVAGDGVPKLLDFGIAHVTGAATELTGADQIVGSPKYMTPEQILGKPVDARTDLYSLGAVLYYLLTGKEAFDGESLQQVVKMQIESMPAPIRRLVPDCPPALESAVFSALQKDAEMRPPSAADFRKMLLGAVPPAGGKH